MIQNGIGTNNNDSVLVNVSTVADSVAVTGPKDDLATVDAYRDTPTTAGETTAPKSAVGGNNKRVANSPFITSLKKASTSVTSLLGGLKQIPTRDKIEALASINRIDNTTGGPLKSLTGDVKDNVIQRMTSWRGDPNEVVKLRYGDDEVSIDKLNFQDADMMKDFLGAFLDDPSSIQLLDTDALGAMLSNMLAKAIEMKLNDAIDKLIEQIMYATTPDPILLEHIRPAARHSDMHVIDLIITHVGKNKIMSYAPDIVEYIAANYSWEGNPKSSNKSTKRNELLSIFERLNPNWYRRVRDGVWISDLSVFEVASRDCTELFSGSEYVVQSVVAPYWNRDNIRVIAKEQFPKAAFKP